MRVPNPTADTETTVCFDNIVELHVNGPAGVKPIAYSDILDDSRVLVANGKNESVLQSTTLRGFDPLAEPVLRVLSDGNWLLLFCHMPPMHELQTFDMDSFGNTLQNSLDAEVVWDDRDVFVIMKRIGEALTEIRECLRRHS